MPFNINFIQWYFLSKNIQRNMSLNYCQKPTFAEL